MMASTCSAEEKGWRANSFYSGALAALIDPKLYRELKRQAEHDPPRHGGPSCFCNTKWAKVLQH
jgi:hypothetical protein